MVSCNSGLRAEAIRLFRSGTIVSFTGKEGAEAGVVGVGVGV